MAEPIKKLTLKQQKFIQYYQGNATEAAIKAGYSKKTAPFIGAENLKKPQILSEIQKRQDVRINKNIATREQRQEFWTSVMNDKNEDMRNRLKAAELLGKSEADFIERHEHSGTVVMMPSITIDGKKQDLHIGND